MARGYGFTERYSIATPLVLPDEVNTGGAGGDRVINAAEAESSDIRIAGWSFGGSQAANLAYDLRRVGARLGRYRLDAAVTVQRLVTPDPVQVFPLKVRRGSVGDNVRIFANFYQHAKKVSRFERLEGQDVPVEYYTRKRSIGDLFIVGDPVSTTLTSPRVVQIQVETQQAGQPQYRDRARIVYDRTRDDFGDTDPLFNGLAGEPRWRLFGNRVNHNTVAWHAYERAKNELI